MNIGPSDNFLFYLLDKKNNKLIYTPLSDVHFFIHITFLDMSTHYIHNSIYFYDLKIMLMIQVRYLKSAQVARFHSQLPMKYL